MATPLTRQDLLAITDGAKNTIMQRMLTKRDVQGATDNARDRILNTINTFHIESQTLMRQVNNQTDQMWRRVTVLEQQLAASRQEVRMLIQAVNRLYEMESQKLNRMRTSEFNEQGSPSPY